MTNGLAGLNVLEWCQMVAGPYCTKLMADLGAEVLKVEPPNTGDEARRRGPFFQDVSHQEGSGLFLYLNTNKLGITLDVADTVGRELFLELVSWADILVADKPPLTLGALDLDYGRLHRINPGLILTCVTPFGQTGPYRNYRAYPLNTYHSGGEGYMTPFIPLGDDSTSGRPPIQVGNFVGEYICGLSAAGATMAALNWRERSGLGQLVDISKQEALIYIIARELERYPLYGRYSSRFTQVFRFQGRFQCRDGYVMISPSRPEHWAAFFEILGPEWKSDSRRLDENYVIAHSSELRPLAEKILRECSKEDLYAEAKAKGLLLAPHRRLDEVVNDPQLVARGFFVEVEHPQLGKVKLPSAPYQLPEDPWRVERVAPRLGEHNEEVYQRWLGHSRGELVKFREAGVI